MVTINSFYSLVDFYHVTPSVLGSNKLLETNIYHLFALIAVTVTLLVLLSESHCFLYIFQSVFHSVSQQRQQDNLKDFSLVSSMIPVFYFFGIYIKHVISRSASLKIVPTIEISHHQISVPSKPRESKFSHHK